MGGSGKWFKSLISLRKPSTNDQEKGGDNGNKKWKLWRSSSESFGFGSSIKKGYGASSASDKYCPSFVDEDEAFNVAVATVIRAPHKDFMVIKKEWAAIRIQAVFRGFLARRALRALRAVVRLQAIFRGQQVRKQAAVTLRCMQALVRVQARVKSRNVSKFPEGKAVQKLLDEHSNQADLVKQAEQGWCDIPGTAEEAKAKLKIRQRGGIKRDRAMPYSHSTQQSVPCVSPNLRSAKPVTPLKHRSLDSKILLECWMAAKPWESRLMEEIYFDSPDMTPMSRKSDDLVPQFNSCQQNGLAKTRRNGVTTRISSKSLTTSQSTPSSSAVSSECMYDDSPVSTSCTSGSPSLPSTNTVMVEATEERNVCTLSYMNLTESTKAKLKACRSSRNLKSLLMDDCLSHSTKTDFLNGDTRGSSGSYPSFNSWKELYATPLRTSFQK